MAIGCRSGQTFSQINVTPLTDVFLVLLVIMMLVAPLANRAVLKVSPPGCFCPTPNAAVVPKLNVNVSADGAVTVNGKPVVEPDTHNIMTMLKAEQLAHPGVEMRLLLGADEDALQKHVVAVMDAAAGCEIKSMTILPPYSVTSRQRSIPGRLSRN